MAPDADATPGAGFVEWPVQPSGCRTMPNEGIQGDEWGAYVTLGRTTRTNAGSPAGREPQGDGVPTVVGIFTIHVGESSPRPATCPPDPITGTCPRVASTTSSGIASSASRILSVCTLHRSRI